MRAGRGDSPIRDKRTALGIVAEDDLFGTSAISDIFYRNVVLPRPKEGNLSIGIGRARHHFCGVPSLALRRDPESFPSMNMSQTFDKPYAGSAGMLAKSCRIAFRLSGLAAWSSKPASRARSTSSGRANPVRAMRYMPCSACSLRIARATA